MKSIVIGIIAMLGIMLLFGLGALTLSQTENEFTVVVQDKERVTDCSGETCESYYLVFTDKGTFKNVDSIIYGKFNSSDVQGMLKEGNSYRIVSIGWRVPFLSMYPNIIEVTPTSSMPRRPVLKPYAFIPSDTFELAALRKERMTGPAEAGPAVVLGKTVWDRIAQCESNQTWDIDTGNGYRGGLQWKTSTWLAVKPADAPRNPAMATRAQEIQAAENLMGEPWGGYQHWPVCSRKVGLR